MYLVSNGRHKKIKTIPNTTLIMPRLICIANIAFSPLRPIDIATPKKKEHENHYTKFYF